MAKAHQPQGGSYALQVCIYNNAQKFVKTSSLESHFSLYLGYESTDSPYSAGKCQTQ